jgi:LemA protein
MMMILLVFFAVIVLIALWFASGYNRLVSLRNNVRNAWSQIDVQLKRRHDLIPNLVETVKGYAGHERETLENVIRARSQAVSAQGVAQQAQAEQGLSSALGRLMVVVEQYPDLKANANFLSLQEELTSTENKISFSRQNYNDQVMTYNTATESVPSNIIAGMFQFKPAEFFEIEDTAQREAPKVSFSR